jgi:hypothetical protein
MIRRFCIQPDCNSRVLPLPDPTTSLGERQTAKPTAKRADPRGR